HHRHRYHQGDLPPLATPGKTTPQTAPKLITLETGAAPPPPERLQGARPNSARRIRLRAGPAGSRAPHAERRAAHPTRIGLSVAAFGRSRESRRGQPHQGPAQSRTRPRAAAGEPAAPGAVPAASGSGKTAGSPGGCSMV